MKSAIILSLLAVVPTLWAADPDSTPTGTVPSGSAQGTPPADLAEEAALVQQMAAEAARGFDAEAHARALRVQIEALVAKSNTMVTSSPRKRTSTVPAAPMTPEAKTSVISPIPAAPSNSRSREAAVREAMRKLRLVLDDMESQLNASQQNP